MRPSSFLLIFSLLPIRLPAQTTPLPVTVSPLLPGITTFSRNFIDPLTARSQYPAHQNNKFFNIMQSRRSYNDLFSGLTVYGAVQHGGENTPFQQMNFSAITASLYVNTDGQGGGFLNLQQFLYGHGDGVGLSMHTACTGVSRGVDEGCEPFRVITTFHGNNWGIELASVTTDPQGQVIFKPRTLGNERVPQPLPGHDLMASAENAPVIDIQPAKIYSAGNVAQIALCPATIVADVHHYGCLTGDSASGWTARYGVTRTTTLTRPIPAAPQETDPFARGPICGPVFVASTEPFARNGLATLSSPEDTLDIATVTAIDPVAKTITLCVAHPHFAGELVTAGGGVGHAIGMSADVMAPHTIPSLDGNTNPSVYRLVYPILGTFPGNVLLTTVLPYNQGNFLSTRAFAGTTPVRLPRFRPQITGGVLSGWTVDDSGNLNAAGPANYGGGTLLASPKIAFTGGHCRTLPKAHAVFTPPNGASPVTDARGTGCDTSLAVTLAYPNPYSIYPMAWARSNQDPGFHPFYAHSEEDQAGYNQFLTASTSGYMLTGGALPGTVTDGFSPGDPVEMTYNPHQQFQSQLDFYRWVLNPGTSGDLFQIATSGIGQADGIFSYDNQEPASTFYGTAINGWGPTSTGGGQLLAPIPFKSKGSISTGLWFTSPPRGTPAAPHADLIRVTCSDPRHPCAAGNWNDYSVLALDGKSGHLSLDFEPELGRLHLSLAGYAQGGLSAPILASTIEASPIGQTTPAPGSFTALKAETYASAANCISAATPARCGTAAAGLVEVAPGATSLVVNTSAITRQSRVLLTYDLEGGPAPANLSTLAPPSLAARTPGVSFTLRLPVAPAGSGIQVQYWILN